MKTKKVSTTTVSQILIAMITDTVVASRIANAWESDNPPFSNEYANLIGGWAVQHFDKYAKPIGSNIQQKFEQYANSARRDDSTVELMDKVLSKLSEDAGDVSSEYILDIAEAHFEGVKAKQLRDDLEVAFDANDTARAIASIESFRKIEIRSNDTTYDLANAWDMVSEAKPECVISYGNQDLGAFFNDTMVRDALVSFIAREKGGKTFWLFDAAIKALKQNRRVVLWSVGDMSFNQTMLRLARAFSGRPLTMDGEYKNCSIPTCISDMGEPEIQTEKLKSVSIQQIKRKMEGFGGKMLLKCTPVSTTKVSEIDSWVTQQRRERGWVPDVIVIDYADILAPEQGSADTRDKINTTWKGLRRLSQEHHCLVLTATQADATAYKSSELSMSSFSEDKRKLAHVNAMIGIGGDALAFQNGVRKMNHVANRETEYAQADYLYAAGCYSIARPAIVGNFPAYREAKRMDRIKEDHELE